MIIKKTKTKDRFDGTVDAYRDLTKKNTVAERSIIYRFFV